MADIQSERLAGIKTALKMGVPPSAIAEHMAKLQGVDIQAARDAGASDEDIITHLVTIPAGPARDPYKQAYEQTNPMMRGMVNIGSGLSSLATGARQIVGAEGPQDQTNIEAGKFLAEQPGGTVGRIVGQSLPFAAAPVGAIGQVVGRGLQGAGMAARSGGLVNAGTAVAASPMADVALLGAGAGALLPAESSGERKMNMGIGAAAGPAAMVGARALGAGAEIGRAWLNPEDVAAKGLLAVAQDPAKLAAMQGTGEIVAGSRPTTAAMTGDAGLLAMERAMRSKDPLAFAAGDEAAAIARRDALGSIAKTPEELAAAKLSRAANEAKFYREALPAVDVAGTPELAALAGRDVVKRAFMQAAKDASNMGAKFGANGKYTGADLHMVKMALDDALQRASSTTTPQGRNAARAVQAARDDFVALLDQSVPGYQQARQSYAQASQPIREMESAQAIQESATRGGGRMAGGVESPTAMQFERAVRATEKGDYGSNFSPAAQKVIDNIAADLRRSELVNAKNVRGLGSDTFQKFASQNVADRALGGNSILARRVQNLPMFQGRNDEVSQMMIRAVADPKYAKMIISKLPTAKDQGEFLKAVANITKAAAVPAAPATAQGVRQ